MSKLYEIQTYTFCDGWVNCWTDDDENPITYSSHEEAQRELEDFLRDQRESFLCGDMAEQYSREDYRIRKVSLQSEEV